MRFSHSQLVPLVGDGAEAEQPGGLVVEHLLATHGAGEDILIMLGRLIQIAMIVAEFAPQPVRQQHDVDVLGHLAQRMRFEGQAQGSVDVPG